MDLHIEFKLASKLQAAQLYRCFYFPDAELEEKDELSALNSSSEKGSPSPSFKISSSTPDAQTCKGFTHRLRAPKLSRQEIDDLAIQFSDSLPEREFSMASLQGYLMVYKIRPHDAVKNFSQWIEKERSDRAAKAS